MDNKKIKRILYCHLPGSACNLNCEYCYITNQHLWNSKVKKMDHSPEEIAEAISPTRTGGICFIVLCGSGETLIPNESIILIRKLVEEGHYIEVVTNGTLNKRFQQIAEFPETIRKHISFKFSFHYAELKRLQLFDVFFSNVWLMHNAGCSFTVEMTPYDGIDSEKEDIKRICMDYLGSYCQLTIARDDMKRGIPVMSSKSLDDYYTFWSDFRSAMLDFKKTIFGVKRREFCYAGLFSANIRLTSGDYSKCYNSPVCGNIFEHIEKPIHFEAIGHCPVAHCYNGHSYLTLGVMPTFKAFSYADIRNIHLKDGTDSLTDEMKEIFSQKLYDNQALLAPNEEHKIYRNALLRQGVYSAKIQLRDIAKKILKR